MDEGIDYVVVEKANTIDYGSIMTQIECVFIGTKNYFFAIPYQIVDFTPGYASDTIETTDMYYAGMPLQEFLLKKCKQKRLSVDEFEHFIINEEFTGVKFLNIEEDCDRFKVQANFWASAIVYNTSKRKVGWKIFLNRFKKDKMKVAEFYSNHSKRVEK